MQLTYDARADRLIWQIRTRDGAMYGVWLTRRMVARLWPPMQKMVLQAAAPVISPQSIAVPEAREMLAEAARHRALPTADFAAAFDPTPVSRPLGPEPLLPDAIDLTPVPGVGGAAGALNVRVRELGGRSLELQLGDDLAAALLRLMEAAISTSAWFGHVAVEAAAEPVERGPDRPLN